MHDKRLIYVLVAVSAIGFFVLPSTLSMFAGQHSWYDPKDDGIPCEKCHFLEAQEMSALVGPHTNETGYGRMECTYCHRGFEIGTSTVADGNEIDPNFTSYFNTSSKVHAGQTLPCLYCHSGSDKGIVPVHSLVGMNCTDCHVGSDAVHGERFVNEDCVKCHGLYSPRHITPAKGFGLTQNATDQAYGGNRSAHTKFVLDAKNMTMLEGANEACLGCHTKVNVNISWTRAEYVSYNVICNSSGYTVSWNASDDLGTNTSRFNSSSGWDW